MVLRIRWQRLVTEDGRTCDRCGGTQDELRKAVEILRESLRPLNIEVASVEDSLSPQECAGDITESNRIWIHDRPLEAWVRGEVGTSPCATCCSELGEGAECRVLSVGGSTYEVIPAELIVKAGLLAASEVLQMPSSNVCCPGAPGMGVEDKPCCPGSVRNQDERSEGAV